MGGNKEGGGHRRRRHGDRQCQKLQIHAIWTLCVCAGHMTHMAVSDLILTAESEASDRNPRQ